MSWMKKSICKNDEFPNRWTSFKIQDIEYAKSRCKQCTVQKECLLMFQEQNIAGVIAGLSEYERLLLQWKEAKNINEFNW